MHTNLNKASFCRMFNLNKKFENKDKSTNRYYKRELETYFYRYQNILDVSGNFNGCPNLEKELLENGFEVKVEGNKEPYKTYVFYVAEEYNEFIKSLFELIESPNTDNAQLAFQLIQNLKTFHVNYKQEEVYEY